MATKLTQFKTLQDEVLKLRNRNADLNKALADIVTDWDSTMHGEIEQFKTSEYGEYWSPVRNMVRSEFIAAARKVLCSTKS